MFNMIIVAQTTKKMLTPQDHNYDVAIIDFQDPQKAQYITKRTE